ncbi:MAG: HAD family hydrolase [Bacillota bacterium]
MKLAVFDFNGTIFPKETIPFLISCWKKYGYSKFKLFKLYLRLTPLIIKYKNPSITKISKEKMKVKFMYEFSKIFDGMSKEEIAEYFRKVENEAKNHYNKKVLKEMDKYREEDFKIIILSGAFIELLINVGARLEVDDIIGSNILNNNINTKKRYSVISGSKKLGALKNKYSTIDIEWNNSYAYADSIDDLKLLKSFGNPVAVNPDEKLLKYAKRNDWKIIN